jgi:hypothetical protein
MIAPRDDISRGLITRAIWKRPCINLFITYFARAYNMSFPFTRGQITCYCPLKMLLPRRQIARRKLCFYYTCEFGVISIQYVIIWIKVFMPSGQHILSGFIKGRIMKPYWTDFCLQIFRLTGFRIFIRNSELPRTQL